MLQAQPSTVLQAILRLSSYSVWIWLAAEALLLIWKGFFLPYTDGALASEWIVLVLLQLTELTRLHWGSRGNLLQESKSLIFLLVFTIPSLLGYLFFLRWQTYVLRIEVALSAIFLTLTGIVFVLGILALINVSKSTI
eukprot:TRINITY_DN8747_c1_g1_i1.p1 TRINITY_DN8747_c1_g1~~TRINITY_DN8747_c1_g1_i1.p1  ORF type:complete len:138 (+),score=6.27 TRINITY_DN8747_c1_g1_i1:87-500(+)